MITGRTLLHYRVLEKIGSGGMGEVYAAEDTRLHRAVALKLLPPALASDAGRLARFEREATAIAALNHPNIVTIHSIERAEGLHFLVMELVRGRTLSGIIPAGGLPLARLLELAIPLADAVSAAHVQGIAHRDLKPDNVMVGDDGRLKVLDFGLAKLAEEAGSGEAGTELPTAMKTEEGVILGTLSYMSPEQAEGRPADARSDVFSLGVVLYEMATGRRPFGGSSRASVLAAILRDAPVPVHDANRALPRDLGRIVRRCLAKDPARRYQVALEVRNELEDLKHEIESGAVVPAELSATATAAPRGVRARPAIMASIALALVSAWVAWVARGAWSGPPPTGGAPAARGTFEQLTDQAGPEIHASLSPDGKLLAYAGQSGSGRDIFVQRIGGQNAINLTNDPDSRSSQPAFSPDGEMIAFRSERDGGGIYVMGATGESLRRLTSEGCNPAWSPDGARIVYATECFGQPTGRTGTSALWVADVASGQSRMLHEGDAVQPAWSPHGLRIAYWAVPEGSGVRDIWTIPADGGDPVPVTQDDDIDWNPVWSPDGGSLYFVSNRGGTMNIWRVSIDEASGRPLGEPQEVTSGVSAWSQNMSLSADGTRMAYVSWLGSANMQKIAFDPQREAVVGDPAWVRRSPGLYEGCAISPDGQRLVCSTASQREDITLMRTDGSDRRELTHDGHKDRRPTWSADGAAIYFYSDRSGSYEIWRVLPDGGGLFQVTDTPGRSMLWPVVSPDGRRLLMNEFHVFSAWILDLGKPFSQQDPEKVEGRVDDRWLAFLDWSPDGRRLAGHGIDETGRYGGIATYDLGDRRVRPVVSYGEYPQWLSDSRRLIFATQDTVFIADANGGREPRPVLSVAPDGILSGSIGISADDRTIYFSRRREEADIWLLTLDR